MGARVAPPNCNDWNKVNDEASQLLEINRSKISFIEKETNHRRGHYPAMGCGISLGQGQKEPKHLGGTNTRDQRNQQICREMFSSLPFKRIAGMQSGEFWVIQG
jgi:hypothetical protein